jgi:hypothetical protein
LLGLANNIWLLSAVIVAVVISFYSLKSIQLLSDTKQDFCRRTLKLFKALGLLQFFAAALLVSRLSISTTVSMTDPSSLIGGTWCLIRVSAAILCSLCILISHAHFIFRWLAFLLQPAIAASDLISELYFVSAANCIRRGLCVYNESMLIWNSAFAVRDLICASLQVRFDFMIV